MALRSDGSFVIGVYERAPDGNEYLVRRMEFPPQKTTVRVLSDIDAIETTHWTPGEHRWTRLSYDYPDGSCALKKGSQAPNQLVGSEKILNYPVAHFRSQTADRVVDEWIALDLACVAVRTVTRGKGDEVLSELNATSLVLGEPDPSLFAVPREFREMGPLAQAEARADKFHGGQLSDQAVQHALQQEQLYQARQRNPR
ncbi:MAG TPA: hypothetical protein VMB03_34645 [Bryobacteraceae bacterium]|nr:hypothetical protein [Bryobacteraceae bacterium]